MSNDDQRLIAASIEGDTAAFGELVRRYQDRLYNTVFRLMDNAEDAYDILQETFLSAYQSLETFKGDSLFFTWLYRIGVNAAISHKRKRRPVFSLHGGRVGEAVIEPADPSDAGRPGYALEQAEEAKKAELQKLHEQLNPFALAREVERQKKTINAQRLLTT